MRVQLEVTGYGINENQAKVNAYNGLKEQYNNNILVYGMLGSEQIKAPTLATCCTTNNIPAKGARKWITVHSVYAVNPLNEKDLKLISEEPGKTEATKVAKKVTLDNQVKTVIKVQHKVDESTGNQALEAEFSPKNAELGQWKFTLDVEVIS